MLEFSVSNQLLSRLDGTAVFSDSQNYLECAFAFSEDWAGLTAVASFGHAEREEPISVRIVEGRCRVPWEVIQPYGFQLSVYGSGEGEEGFTHVPTNVVTVEVGAAGTAVGLAAAAPTPGLYDTLLAELRRSETAALAAKGQAVTAAAEAKTAAEQATTAKETAVEQADICGAQAQRAAESAQSAQRSESNAQRSQERVSEMAGWVADDRVLSTCARMDAQSYAVGILEGKLVAAPAWSALTAGTQYQAGYLGLEADQRYMAEIDGTIYRARATRVVTDAELGGLVPQSGESGSGASSPARSGDKDEQPEPVPGEIEGPDTPVILDPMDTGKYENVVKLQLGPVTVWDGLFVEQTSQQRGESIWETSGQRVVKLTLYTDGMDNARFYMKQAEQAALRAERALAAIRAAQNQA